jgi:inner membrane protein
VDNVTHAFVGAAMAECAVPNGAAARTRAVLMFAGVVAANAPDIDLVYTGIIEEPLGYLLHHRGHSHTVPGLAALGLLIWGGLRVLPRAWESVRGAERRVIALIAAALISHVLMDTANGYGTHLFYPISSRWVYGDSVFVLEPWLWATLGATLTMNAGRWLWRLLVPLLTLFLIGTLFYIDLLPLGIVAVMIAAVGAATMATQAWNRKKRAVTALVATAAIFIAMSGVSRLVKAEAGRQATAVQPGEVIDIVADSNPGVPWCWAVLTLQKSADANADALIARRGTLSLLPSMWPAASCASARLSVGRWSTDVPASSVVVWHRQWRIDLAEVRRLSVSNCRVRAWLQFGRAPHVANGVIADLRFENPIGQNFTPMRLDNGSQGCPAYLTSWEPPRRDLLQ